MKFNLTIEITFNKVLKGRRTYSAVQQSNKAMLARKCFRSFQRSDTLSAECLRTQFYNQIQETFCAHPAYTDYIRCLSVEAACMDEYPDFQAARTEKVLS